MFARKIENFFPQKKELNKINSFFGGGQSVYRHRTGVGAVWTIPIVDERVKNWPGV
jgi:hypothetical protein